MNSAVEPSFKVFFVEKSTCGSHEQCMESIVFQPNAGTHGKRAIQTHTKSLLKTSKIAKGQIENRLDKSWCSF